jgi:hypothetical protein
MTLRELAKQAWSEHEGDIDAAIKTVLDALNGDARLRAEVTTPLLNMAVRQEIQNAMRLTRKEFWPETKPRVDTYGALLRTVERELMDYPLPNGMLLRVAKREDVSSAAGQLIEVGKTSLRRGRWLSYVAAELKDGRATVEQQLTNADLRRLQRRVEKEPEQAAQTPVAAHYRRADAQAPTLPA